MALTYSLILSLPPLGFHFTAVLASFHKFYYYYIIYYPQNFQVNDKARKII